MRSWSSTSAQRVTFYIGGLPYCRWTLDATEQTKATGNNFGIAGDTNSVGAKRLYLHGVFIASAETADVVPAFSPQISATEMRYGVVKGADATDIAAVDGANVLGWSTTRLKAFGDSLYHSITSPYIASVGLTWGTIPTFGGTMTTGIVHSDINSAGTTSRAVLAEATLVTNLLTQANVYDAVKAIIGQGANITVTPNDTAHTLAIAGQMAGGMGATSWLGLSDTPATFSGQAGKLVSVNSAGDALEFTIPTPPTTGDMTLAVLATALSGGLQPVNPNASAQQDFLLLWDTSAMALASTGVGDLASVIVAANPTSTSATLTSLTVAGVHYALPSAGGGPDTNSFVTGGAFTFDASGLSLQLTGNTGFTTVAIPAIALPTGGGTPLPPVITAVEVAGIGDGSGTPPASWTTSYLWQPRELYQAARLAQTPSWIRTLIPGTPSAGDVIAYNPMGQTLQWSAA